MSEIGKEGGKKDAKPETKRRNNYTLDLVLALHLAWAWYLLELSLLGIGASWSLYCCWSSEGF
jgi:hypothetical protein